MATTLKAKSMMPSITVNDLDKSIRFYTEGLGFKLGEKYEQGGKLMGVMIDAGDGSMLGLSQDDFAKGRDRTKGVGMRLWVETEQDIQALANQAKTAGIQVEGPMNLPWGPLAFSVTDPDGFNLSVSAPYQEEK